MFLGGQDQRNLRHVERHAWVHTETFSLDQIYVRRWIGIEGREWQSKLSNISQSQMVCAGDTSAGTRACLKNCYFRPGVAQLQGGNQTRNPGSAFGSRLEQAKSLLHIDGNFLICRCGTSLNFVRRTRVTAF